MEKENNEGKETANLTASLEQSFVPLIDKILMLAIRLIMDWLKLFSSIYKQSFRINTLMPAASDIWFGKQFKLRIGCPLQSRCVSL